MVSYIEINTGTESVPEYKRYYLGKIQRAEYSIMTNATQNPLPTTDEQETLVYAIWGVGTVINIRSTIEPGTSTFTTDAEGNVTATFLEGRIPNDEDGNVVGPEAYLRDLIKEIRQDVVKGIQSLTTLKGEYFTDDDRGAIQTWKLVLDVPGLVIQSDIKFLIGNNITA